MLNRKLTWLGIVVLVAALAASPGVSFAGGRFHGDGRFDRGRFESFHGDDGFRHHSHSNFSFSLGLGLGAIFRPWDDCSYSRVTYRDYDYCGPSYYTTTYYAPAAVYVAPAPPPPAVVYYPARTYYYDSSCYSAPPSSYYYGEVRYRYGR